MVLFSHLPLFLRRVVCLALLWVVLLSTFSAWVVLSSLPSSFPWSGCHFHSFLWVVLLSLPPSGGVVFLLLLWVVLRSHLSLCGRCFFEWSTFHSFFGVAFHLFGGAFFRIPLWWCCSSPPPSLKWWWFHLLSHFWWCCGASSSFGEVLLAILFLRCGWCCLLPLPLGGVS